MVHMFCGKSIKTYMYRMWMHYKQTTNHLGSWFKKILTFLTKMNYTAEKKEDLHTYTKYIESTAVALQCFVVGS